MSNVFYIESDYVGSLLHRVELPEGKTFADIRKWYVKWGNFHYTFDDVNWHTVEDTPDELNYDMKRPAASRVYPDKDGQPDYEFPLED